MLTWNLPKARNDPKLCRGRIELKLSINKVSIVLKEAFIINSVIRVAAMTLPIVLDNNFVFVYYLQCLNAFAYVNVNPACGGLSMY